MSAINVLIVHHHMRGGGVTEVIRRTFGLFADSEVRLGLITGESTSEHRNIPHGSHRSVDGLSYGDAGIPPSLGTVYADCIRAARDLFGELPDIWHIHNHSLGKNPIYTALALKLITEGHRVLLHAHDFAEDNRPANFKQLSAYSQENEKSQISTLYPVADHVRYAVLNHRDGQILSDAGIPETSVKVVANPVSIPDSDPGNSTVKGDLPENLILYPVRAIPRKNIGEYMLWATLYRNEATFALTLAPQNPKYRSHYRDWVHFGKEHEIPLIFEASQQWQCSYKDLISSSKAFLTSSVAEGFGLVYLESFLMGKPLLGRDLPGITKDFKEEGVNMSGLYDRLPVPLHWLDELCVTKTFTEQIETLFDSYGRPFTEETKQQWLTYIFRDQCVDYGALNAEMQRQVIRQVLEDRQKQDELKMVCTLSHGHQPIKENQKVIQNSYGPHQYGVRLKNLYMELLKAEPSEVRSVPADSVLSGFLKPELFSLLRL